MSGGNAGPPRGGAGAGDAPGDLSLCPPGWTWSKRSCRWRRGARCPSWGCCRRTSRSTAAPSSAASPPRTRPAASSPTPAASRWRPPRDPHPPTRPAPRETPVGDAWAGTHLHRGTPLGSRLGPPPRDTLSGRPHWDTPIGPLCWDTPHGTPCTHRNPLATPTMGPQPWDTPRGTCLPHGNPLGIIPRIPQGPHPGDPPCQWVPMGLCRVLTGLYRVPIGICVAHRHL